MTMAEARVFAHEVVAGRYRLLEVFSRETDRLWWYAEDLVAGRPRLVARTVLPESAGEDTARRLTTRVLHACETMRLLRPGRVAEVVDAVVEGGALWTVTEWIDGTPLGELLARKGPLDPARAARLGLDLLDVLQAAHDEGLTHGELSPGQVFVREDGPAVVTGFGTAGATLAPRLAAPSYAAPEQARDERIGPAADLWALGALLYTAVEGRPPFRDHGRAEATLRAVDRLPLRTPLRAGPLTQAVRGLLHKNPRDRPPRPALREALTRALRETAAPPGRPPSRTRRRDARDDTGRRPTTTPRLPTPDSDTGRRPTATHWLPAPNSDTGRRPDLATGTGDAHGGPSATLPREARGGTGPRSAPVARARGVFARLRHAGTLRGDPITRRSHRALHRTGQAPPHDGRALHRTGQTPPHDSRAPYRTGQTPPHDGQALYRTGQVPPRDGRAPTRSRSRLLDRLQGLPRSLPGLPRSVGRLPRSISRLPRGRRVLVAGAALAVVVVTGVVLAASGVPSGTRPAAAPPRAVAPAAPADRRTGGTPPGATPTASASPTPSLPAGYRPYRAPEGFSVALPGGWRRLTTSRAGGLAYRVTFGRGGGGPTLAVTYSERVGPDPVAVWRGDVEPGLARLPGYRRIGAVRATTYQGRPAADLEWLAGSGSARSRTFGRGLLLGGRRGFSLRFTAPAATWDDTANRVALTTFLRTFRVPGG
ncbi:serine/threonine protein kinase [Streptomyces eurythermus]|uniref:serine/threonine protein kinase n=1 Tax=Streptomyces eurythermus TaxID=42237 RepID=UPI0036D29568